MGRGGGAVPRAWTLGFPIKEQVTRRAVQPARRRGGLSGAWALRWDVRGSRMSKGTGFRGSYPS